MSYKDIGAKLLRQMTEEDERQPSHSAGRPLEHEYQPLTEAEKAFAHRSTLDTALER